MSSAAGRDLLDLSAWHCLIRAYQIGSMVSLVHVLKEDDGVPLFGSIINANLTSISILEPHHHLSIDCAPLVQLPVKMFGLSLGHEPCHFANQMRFPRNYDL